ncbi:SPOR domain-containing protein [Moraxella sp. Tifton1]|uniref:SPOR domain-containing protein n=1 Tax=Moraxella oculi TaxID=2940516 RepID=UPI0020134463|nr:SPOR domain-containing protein [Moraxella sp. Tifton1]MCL1623050.1 SPOR domain-containing protein [Moraxella sp. Tifton1]
MASKKKSSAVYKDARDKQHAGLLSLLWMILAVVVVMVLLVMLYFSPMAESYRNSTKIVIAEEEPVKPIAQTNTMPSPGFDFYEVLPKQDFRSVPEGVSVQETVNTTAKMLDADAVVYSDLPDETWRHEKSGVGDAQSDKTDAKNTITYILQIKSFADAKEADEKRAEVMWAGVDATVVRRMDAKTGDVSYQVISMPMISRSEASEALFRLRNNGIDAMMVEQHHR